MNEGKLIILTAPSGTGKTTICRELLKRNKDWKFSVSVTTRPQREGEIEGEDYIYMDVDKFEHHVKFGEFIEWEWVHGNKYGTACHSNPEKWLKDSSYFENDIIDKKEQAIETILMGLRLKEGVSEQKIKSITGAGFEYVLDMERLKIAIDKGLIEFQERLKTTQKGRLTLNSVLSYILN